MTYKERNPVGFFIVANVDERRIDIYERKYYRSGSEFKLSNKMHKIKTIDFPVRYSDPDEEKYYLYSAAFAVGVMYGPGTMIEKISGKHHDVLILDEEVHWREMHW